MRKKSKKQEEPVTFQIEPQTPQPAQFVVEQPQQQPQTEQVPEFKPEIPMAQPVGKPKGPEFQCPECNKIFILAVTKRPAHIKCPYCGLEGIVD